MNSALDRLRSSATARFAALSMLMIFLAACSATPEDFRPCPRVAVLTDASKLIKFAGQDRDLTDVLFEAEIQDVQLACEYDDNDLKVAMGLRIMASRGPADTSRQADLRYFVAVATLKRQVVAREEFALTVKFPGNRTRIVGVEELSPRIPVAYGKDGSNYMIFIGFILTPAELNYNRENL